MEDQWHVLLRKAGFSGIDGILHDYPNCIEHTGSVIISTAVPKETPSPLEDVIVISSNPRGRVSLGALEEGLKNICKQSPRVISFEEVGNVDMVASYCIFLDELDGSILPDPSHAQFVGIQTLCRANYLLWVVQGASDGSFSPESNLAIGLARTIRNESGNAKCVTLDLDTTQQLDPHRTAEVICGVFKATLISPCLAPESDNEYMERNDRIYIPRLVNDAITNEYIAQQTGQAAPSAQPFNRKDRTLRLAQETPGNLDTFYYVDDDELEAPLKDDHVEIQIQATGVGFNDMLAATGKISSDRLGGECSGVIMNVGKMVGSSLEEGDRVCALVKSSYSTLTRCPSQLVVKIPNWLSFDSAACIPVAFSTAYHALVELARLAPGESVLIHAAAGSVGQAAISIAQMIGADVYATVGNEEKKMLILNKYKLGSDHIFSSRDLNFGRDILYVTKDRGVDVVLNSVGGDAFEVSWQCLSMFGRFVDITKRDPLIHHPEMTEISHNRAYFAVNLDLVKARRPDLLGKAFTSATDLLFSEKLKEINPIISFPMSEVSAAFCVMRSRESIGKMIVKPKPGDFVMVCCFF